MKKTTILSLLLIFSNAFMINKSSRTIRLAKYHCKDSDLVLQFNKRSENDVVRAASAIGYIKMITQWASDTRLSVSDCLLSIKVIYGMMPRTSNRTIIYNISENVQ